MYVSVLIAPNIDTEILEAYDSQKLYTQSLL